MSPLIPLYSDLIQLSSPVTSVIQSDIAVPQSEASMSRTLPRPASTKQAQAPQCHTIANTTADVELKRCSVVLDPLSEIDLVEIVGRNLQTGTVINEIGQMLDFTK